MKDQCPLFRRDRHEMRGPNRPICLLCDGPSRPFGGRQGETDIEGPHDVGRVGKGANGVFILKVRPDKAFGDLMSAKDQWNGRHQS